MDLGADNAMLSAIRARMKTRARASCGGHGVRFFRPSDMARVMEEAERATEREANLGARDTPIEGTPGPHQGRVCRAVQEALLMRSDGG